jgi:hypothetical protein
VRFPSGHCPPPPHNLTVPSEEIATDRPDVTNSSLVVPVGSFQSENGLNLSSRDGGRTGDGTNSRWRLGIAPCLEVLVDLPTFFANVKVPGSSGFSDVAPAVKWQISPLPGKIDLSVTIGVALPTGVVRRQRAQGRRRRRVHNRDRPTQRPVEGVECAADLTYAPARVPDAGAVCSSAGRKLDRSEANLAGNGVPLRRLLERKGSSLNALRLGEAAVKHPSQLHDLMGWGGDSEAHRAGVLYVGTRRNAHHDHCCCCLCNFLRCGPALVGAVICLDRRGAPMVNKVVVQWSTKESIGAGQIRPRQEPCKFESRAAAVKYVMEELEKSKRHNVRMIVEGIEFSFVDIVRMYARKPLSRRSRNLIITAN